MVYNRVLGENLPLIECYNSVRKQWLLRWHDGNEDGWVETILQGKPTLEHIKEIVIGWIDEQTDSRIISGFHYEGALVWLSRENQINYKAAFDLAMQFAGEHGTLPITFKFGTTEEPVYRKFETLEDLTAFYLATVGYIQGELAKGWAIKDSIDWTKYEETQV